MDALIVVDMQVGLLNGEPKHDLHGVIERINRLAAKVRERSGTVIFMQHCGGKGDDFEPEKAGLGASTRTAPRPHRYRGSEDPERSLRRDRPVRPLASDRAGPDPRHGMGNRFLR
jgi:nicotinamidase-related amidase